MSGCGIKVIDPVEDGLRHMTSAIHSRYLRDTPGTFDPCEVGPKFELDLFRELGDGEKRFDGRQSNLIREVSSSGTPADFYGRADVGQRSPA